MANLTTALTYFHKYQKGSDKYMQDRYSYWTAIPHKEQGSESVI
jgi:hypothetical protein